PVVIEFLFHGVGLLGSGAGRIQISVSVFVAAALLFDRLEGVAGVFHLGRVEKINRSVVTGLKAFLSGGSGSKEDRDGPQPEGGKAKPFSTATPSSEPSRQSSPQEMQNSPAKPHLASRLPPALQWPDHSSVQ